MPSCRVPGRAFAALLALSFLVSLASCNRPAEKPLKPSSQTWAELRVVRRAVTVTPPGQTERAPYPRERLVDGEAIKVSPEGLFWLRRDGGATLLVRGSAALVARAEAVEVNEGKVFVDTPVGRTAELVTPSGPLHLSAVRASIDVRAGTTEVYVLAGEVKTDSGGHAGAGERLIVTGQGKDAKAVTAPVVTWEDWTGGLATTDRTAEPAPYGVGTVGARRPGATGAPHSPLAIQKLDVRVSINQDFAVTEVDELFFNPTSEVVEGVYRFRTPGGAVLHRFGVDRDGAIKWGRVKEKAAAAAQYQANVYQGSTEDPALLEWDAPGVYRARLYPIGPGESRRVVVTYAEWLGRTGPKHERRLYVYPMAAEGAEASLPHIEELHATIDLGGAGAKEVRAGMAGQRDGDTLVVREHDFVPRADLSVELFDEGVPLWKGYQAPHTLDLETLPPAERNEAQKKVSKEADYVLVPVPGDTGSEGAGAVAPGIDLAIVVDTSAATEPSALAISRAATAALLAHLGKDDRVAVFAGDASLRPVIPGRRALTAASEALRREVLTRLSTVDRGGATDLGAMLGEAAAVLDPAPGRRGAVVYVGDGAPTVGELSLVDLRDKLSKLPRPVRFFGLGIGDGADMSILEGLSRGAFAERIGDESGAARAALRLLEAAERPARLGASIDLGPAVERIFPRDLGALVADESQVVVGRLLGATPTVLTVTTQAGTTKVPLKVGTIEDHGDLRRRWAEGRLAQMMVEGAGRAALVDLGSSHGIITPVTSLYVPTKNEMSAEERSELEEARLARRTGNQRRKRKRDERWAERQMEEREAEPQLAAAADNKEGGTGTRAKGEEGSMGRPMFGNRKQAQAESAAMAPPAQMAAAAATASPAAAPMPVAPSPSPARGPVIDGLASVTKGAPPAAPKADQAPGGGPAVGGEHWAAGATATAAAASAVAPADIPAFNGPAGRMPEGKPALAEPGPLHEKSKVALKPDARALRDIAGKDTGVRDETFDPGAGSASALPDGDSGGFGAGLGLSGIGEGGGGRGDGLVLNGVAGNVDKAQRLDARLAGDLQGDGAKTRSMLRQELEGRRSEITIRVSEIGHSARLCSAGAWLPLEERVALWRERFAGRAGNASGVAQVYSSILAGCEAPTWRERSRLFSLMLDAMPTVRGKVALWRVMLGRLGAGDALYRGILARVRTPAEMRELHDALGLAAIDPGVLAKTLKDAKTPGEKVKKLRELWAVWPNDFALALQLLDAIEDTGDDAAARELGKLLRARPDADARVRTAVGELYLRIAARDKTPEEKALDEGEARRAFGEIVEFAPEDPTARRRIGDLLRAHGWFAEAERHYETLARLLPDDAGATLLRAAAAQGLGKLEEAVKWTEKGGAVGGPDEGMSPARSARALAATWLAWGKLDALAAGKVEEVAQ